MDDARDELIEINKAVEQDILAMIDNIATLNGVDKRWIAIGKTHIEQGFMAVNRAIKE